MMKNNYLEEMLSVTTIRRAAMMLLAALLTMTAQTAWAQTTSTINVGGTDYALFTGFTATGGNGTNYAKLVDGNTSTDWSAQKNFDDPNAPAGDFAGGTADPAFVEFHAEKPFIPKGYVLTCDHENPGFWKPYSWALKAKLNEGDAWTTIHSSTTTLGTGKMFNIDCTNTGDNPYQYFRFEVYEVGSTMHVDLDELQFYGKLCLVQAREATCTEYGLSADCYGGFGDKYYSDDCATTELTVGNGLIAKLAHTAVHHVATSTNIEYWQCSVCHKYFNDSDCTTEITEAETQTTVFGTLANGCYTLTSQTYTLTDDINTAGYIYVPSGVTATIDLAGHTIDRGLTSAVEKGYVIKVEGTLTLTDSGTGGTVKGGMCSGWDKISCVYVSDGGNFTLAGGTLIGNTNITGSAVYCAYPSSRITMTGGKITGDVCGIEADGYLTISGGEISGNSEQGVWPKNYSMSISGNPRITDNGNVNVNLYSGEAARLTVVGALTEGASIGITPNSAPTADAPVTVTNGYSTYNTASPGTYFTVDNNGQIQTDPDEYTSVALGWNEDRTEVVVAVPIDYTITYHANGGTMPDSYTTTYTFASETVTLAMPTRTGYTFGGWYDNDGLAGDAVTTIANGSRGNKEFWAKWKKLLSNTDITVSIPSKEWTGSALTPVITVTDGETPLTEGTDYSVTAPDSPIQNSGEYIYTINGVGNYAGETTAKFTITPHLDDQWGAVFVYVDQNGRTAILDGTWQDRVEIVSQLSLESRTVKFVKWRNRTFTPGKASTVMLPFDYTCTGSEGGTFYRFVGVEKVENTWVATMKATGDDANNTGSLIANTPYLFMPTATAMTFTIPDGGVTLCTEDGGNCQTADEGSHWTFKGTYRYIEWTAGTTDPNFTQYAEEIGRTYGFAGVAKDGINVGDFVKVASGAKIRPMCCYLLWNDEPNEAHARALTRSASDNIAELPQRIVVKLVGANGETTGIGTLDTTTGEVTFDGWYTMNGVRLEGKPTKKGLYINNGHKVVIK